MHLYPTGRRRDVDDELCAMFDESSQCTIVLPEECLGYAPVVPLAFSLLTGSPLGLWFRIITLKA